MEVGHDEETNDGDDDADELYFFIRRGATGEIVGDFLIEDGNGGAGGQNEDASQEPTEAKIPIHKLYYTLDFIKKIV